MKKKILTMVVALACTTACAVTFAACGGGGDGDDNDSGLLTEAQWKEQFNAEINSPDYSFKQYHYDETQSQYVHDADLYVNKSVRGYSQSYYENDACGTSSLFINDGIYYESYDYHDSNIATFGTRTHTAAEFARTENEEFLSGYNTIIEQVLTLCRDKFSDFTSDAGTTYEAKNVSVTINNPFTEADMDVTVGRLTMIFQDKKLANIGLYDIEGDDLETKMQWEYYVGANIQNIIDGVTLPQIKGAKYELTAVSDSDFDSYVTENAGKYVELKNDGTLGGDISIDGLSVAGGTVTCGDDGIVVTVGEYTLTGYCKREDTTTTIVLTLSIDEDYEIAYTFTQIL